jgi:hypothetical protein
MIEYIYQLMSIPIDSRVVDNIEKVSDKCTVVTITTDNTVSFNFNLDTHTKLEMFSKGYIQMKEFWENN